MSKCTRCFLEYRDESLVSLHPAVNHARMCRACSRAVRQIIGWLEYYGVVIQYDAASNPPTPLITKSDIPVGDRVNGHRKIGAPETVVGVKVPARA